VQVAQLASNPVFVTAVVESAAVPEPVTHEAQIEFVESQAYPGEHCLQVKAKVETVQSSQSLTNPVYVNDVPVFAPVPQLTQAEFPESHS